jgi:hypothetical protein
MIAIMGWAKAMWLHVAGQSPLGCMMRADSPLAPQTWSVRLLHQGTCRALCNIQRTGSGLDRFDTLYNSKPELQMALPGTQQYSGLRSGVLPRSRRYAR